MGLKVNDNNLTNMRINTSSLNTHFIKKMDIEITNNSNTEKKQIINEELNLTPTNLFY